MQDQYDLNGGLLEARFSCIPQHIIQWPRWQVGLIKVVARSSMFPRWRWQRKQAKANVSGSIYMEVVGKQVCAVYFEHLRIVDACRGGSEGKEGGK
jgi:hypothetical protein